MSPTRSVLLGTTIVVDHLRGKAPSVIEQFRQTTTLYLPVTALGELLFGAYKSAFKVKSLEQIKSFIQLCAILGVDEQTASYYGRIGAELGGLGNSFHKTISGLPPSPWNTIFLWPRATGIFPSCQD